MAPWIIKELDAQLGESKTNRILASINQPARQAARINTQKITQVQAVDYLNAHEHKAIPSEVAEDGIVVSNECGKIRAFPNGSLTVQDRVPCWLLKQCN